MGTSKTSSPTTKVIAYLFTTKAKVSSASAYPSLVGMCGKEDEMCFSAWNKSKTFADTVILAWRSYVFLCGKSIKKQKSCVSCLHLAVCIFLRDKTRKDMKCCSSSLRPAVCTLFCLASQGEMVVAFLISSAYCRSPCSSLPASCIPFCLASADKKAVAHLISSSCWISHCSWHPAICTTVCLAHVAKDGRRISIHESIPRHMPP